MSPVQSDAREANDLLQTQLLVGRRIGKKARLPVRTKPKGEQFGDCEKKRLREPHRRVLDRRRECKLDNLFESPELEECAAGPRLQEFSAMSGYA